MVANNKKKTTEEYIEELKIKNPNLEVLGEYINSKTKIKHRCKTHDYVWDIFPSNALKGCGCHKCGGNYQRTHQEYVEELKIKNPELEVIGQFTDIKTKVSHRCLIHNIIFDKTPSEALTGSGCQQCHIDKTIAKRTKTHEQYVNELAIANPNIEVIEKYSGAEHKILHKCKICEYEWSSIPSNMLNKKGCPKCSKKYHRTHDEYVNDVKSINPNLDVVDTFIDVKTKIRHRCLIHNIEWMTTPDSVLNSMGLCSQCIKELSIRRFTKTHEQYVQELSIVNPNIEVVGNYSKASEHIRHKCKICNHEWMTTPSNLLSGHSCPMCNISNGEYQVKKWLEDKCINYEPQKKFVDCRDVFSLPFDFYIPDYNICIEYDGEQHFKPVSFGSGNKKRVEEIFEYTQRHDKIKTEYCERNGIKLIRIAYNENVKEKLDLLFA